MRVSSVVLFLSLSLFLLGTVSGTEIININWANAVASREAANCTESCDSICGNGKCEIGESPCNCPCDCGFCCKDGFCREDKGESFDNCPSDCSLTLTAQVVDLDSSLPLPTSPQNSAVRASVTCNSRTKTYGPEFVGSDGTYSWAGVRPDYYTCTATLAGYQVNSQQILLQTVDLNLNRPAMIPLQILLGTISGVVRYTPVGVTSLAPLSAATVSCTGANNKAYFRQSESPFGAYFVASLPPGTYTCTASKNAYQSDSYTINVVSGQNTLQNFVLFPLPGNLLGQVIDTVSGLGAPRMNVNCSSVLGISQTNTEGFFYLTGVPAGTLSCVAFKSGFISGSVSLTVPQGANVNTTIYVTTITSTLTGVVHNSKDRSEFIPDAVITCRTYTPLGEALATDVKVVTSDRLGNYKITGFLPGNYTCTAEHMGFGLFSIDLYFPVSTDVTQNLAMDPLVTTISGLVLDKWTGVPINEVSIVCFDTDRNIETARRGSRLDGSYDLPAISGGGINNCAYNKLEYLPETICERLIRGLDYYWVVYLTPRTANLTGTVRDIRNRSPIANVNVTCSSAGNRNLTVTNGIGQYSFVNLRAGFHFCTYDAPRYQSNFTTVYLNSSINPNVRDALLTPLPATIKFEIYDSSLGLLIPANVTCRPPNGAAAFSFTTDFLGLYNVYDVFNTGTWSCNASRTGFIGATNSTFIDFGITYRFQIYITPDMGMIGGLVTDTFFGAPIPNAVVDCQAVSTIAYSVFANTLGQYRIINLNRGVYGCLAYAEGFSSASATVTLVEGQAYRQDFQLVPFPSSITFYVLDNDELKQSPLGNATVTCRNGTTTFVGTTEWNYGTTSFTDLLRGTFSCNISYPNYDTQPVVIQLATGENRDVTVLLEPTRATITGTVFSVDSTPSNVITIPGAQIVAIVQSTGRVIARVFSGADGTYSFRVRVPDVYQFNVSASLFNSFFGSVGRVTANRNIAITLIPANLLITIKVTEDGTGAAISNAGVGIRRIVTGESPQAVGFQVTDSNGNAAFSNLGPATYSVSVSATGYDDPTAQTVAALFSGRVYPLNFTMKLKIGEVRGNIQLFGGTSSASLGGFTVTIISSPGGANLATTTTDNNGAFTFSNIAPGSYTIRVTKTGFNPSVTDPFTLSQGTSARLNVIQVTEVAGGIFGNVFKAGTVNEPTGVAIQVRVRIAGTGAGDFLGSATIPSLSTSFLIEGLPPGYLYEVLTTCGASQSGCNYKDRIDTVQVVSGQNSPITIYISP